MVKAFVTAWDERKDALRGRIAAEHPDSYETLVRWLVEEVLTDLDRERITMVDHGDYQGTEVYVVAAKGYQPGAAEHYITHNEYGSCSGCDTLLAISDYSDGTPTADQVDAYMTLALHLLQRLAPVAVNRWGGD